MTLAQAGFEPAQRGICSCARRSNHSATGHVKEKDDITWNRMSLQYRFCRGIVPTPPLHAESGVRLTGPDPSARVVDVLLLACWRADEPVS